MNSKIYMFATQNHGMSLAPVATDPPNQNHLWNEIFHIMRKLILPFDGIILIVARRRRKMDDDLRSVSVDL